MATKVEFQPAEGPDALLYVKQLLLPGFAGDIHSILESITEAIIRG
jgi:hypothetical protein